MLLNEEEQQKKQNGGLEYSNCLLHILRKWKIKCTNVQVQQFILKYNGTCRTADVQGAPRQIEILKIREYHNKERLGVCVNKNILKN